MADGSNNVKKILWDGIVDIGFVEEEDAWFPGKVRYFNGYTAKRTILYQGHEYNITCKIFSSNTNRPLFECRMMCDDKLISNFVATNPTTAVKKTLVSADINMSFKNGNWFFGLDRLDVIKMKGLLRKETEVEANIEKIMMPNSISATRQASWFGVITFGTPNYDKKYLCSFGGRSFRLQSGYEALRNMIIDNGKEVIVHCKIDSDIGENIIFKCFSTDEPVFSIESKRPTELVRMLYAHLNISTKKKWSGYEFFGFMKPDVLNILTAKPTEPSKHSKLHKADIDHEVLKLGMKVRSRNAGETSSLKHNKSIKKRNETIHKLVEYVSFGDIGSEFLYYIYNIYIYIYIYEHIILSW